LPLAVRELRVQKGALASEGKNPDRTSDRAQFAAARGRYNGRYHRWGRAQRGEKPLGSPHYRFDRIGFRDYNFRSGQKQRSREDGT